MPNIESCNHIRIDTKPLSDNKLWMGVHKKTAEYRRYEKVILEALGDIFKLEPKKTSIHFTFGFSNSRSDATNPLKALCDILGKKFEEWDDRMIYHVEIDKKLVAKGEEYIDINVEYLE